MVEIELPHSEIAERAIIGSMILEPDNIPLVLEHLSERDFYFEHHRAFFSLLCKIWEDKGRDWDDVVLRDYIVKNGLSAKISLEMAYALAKEGTKGALLEEAIRSVKEKSGMRTLVELSLEVLKRVKQEPELGEIIELINEKVQEISEKHVGHQFYHIRDIIKLVLEIIEQNRNKDRIVTGKQSGFIELDQLTNGFQQSDYIVIAARPGMGKSSFMLSIALNMALEERLPVVIYSLEMSKEQLIMRALSMHSGIALQKLRNGNLISSEMEKLHAAALNLSRANILIDDSATLTATDIRLRTRKLKKEMNIGAIFIDYLQLIKIAQKRASRQEEVAETSRNLKSLAKELSVPVIALAQLSRQVEHRADKRPQLADLRESGQIEQDADLVIFIHRPEYYKKKPLPEEEGVAEIIVAKQRQGPTGIVKLAFLKETTGFKNLQAGIMTFDSDGDDSSDEDMDIELD
ncbi:MAG: replicative DNA helicase [Aquificaceae bacterium]|nr:replicative DNA helicase [Aquificaceae bacterium]MDW8236913.1 replicative DNA helicase [Aquificaceae bacterium]